MERYDVMLDKFHVAALSCGDEVIVRHRALKLYVFSNKIVCCVDGGILIIEFPVWGFMITGNVRELMQSCNRLLGQY